MAQLTHSAVAIFYGPRRSGFGKDQNANAAVFEVHKPVREPTLVVRAGFGASREMAFALERV